MQQQSDLRQTCSMDTAEHLIRSCYMKYYRLTETNDAIRQRKYIHFISGLHLLNFSGRRQREVNPVQKLSTDCQSSGSMANWCSYTERVGGLVRVIHATQTQILHTFYTRITWQSTIFKKRSIKCPIMCKSSQFLQRSIKKSCFVPPPMLLNFHCNQRRMTTGAHSSTAAGGEAIKENKMIDHFRKWNRCGAKCWQLLKPSHFWEHSQMLIRAPALPLVTE